MSRLEQYDKEQDHLRLVFETKNKAYGDSFFVSMDKYGPMAALVRIHDKHMRMDQLIHGAKANDESLLDTVEDMANYCTMFAMWLKENHLTKSEKSV